MAGAIGRLRRACAAAVLAVSGTGAAAQGCPEAPDPVLTLDFASRYVEDDTTRSEIDPEAEAAAEAALRPLDDYLRDLGAQAEAMLLALPEERAALAECLMAQMAAWARADALVKLVSPTVRLTIGARLAAFGIVAGRAAAETGDTQDARAVADWLSRRMWEQMVFWETAPNGAARGNLRAWAALAGAAVAGLADDPLLRGWAAWSVAYVACSAAPDGSLPQEMRRGARALHYQLHALAPLVTATLLLDRQGLPPLARCPGALDRAAGFALRDLEDGAQSLEITGEVQTLVDGSDPLEDFQLAWLEAYLALGKDPEVLALARDLAAPRRPLNFSKLGGNQTLLWMGE